MEDSVVLANAGEWLQLLPLMIVPGVLAILTVLGIVLFRRELPQVRRRSPRPFGDPRD